MKTLKGTLFVTGGIILGVLSVGCGGAIENASSGYAALFYAGLSVALLTVALILCALGMNEENEYTCRKNRKINRVPHHTNEWRNVE